MTIAIRRRAIQGVVTIAPYQKEDRYTHEKNAQKRLRQGFLACQLLEHTSFAPTNF
jgi:hypothetical protein